ncbi:MAG: TspO/MBR family protein [Gemmiger sp.]|uniref:TspO/MBR family protein n=1 Tax=Gemmiger sp. TaxID=2049027 RepID=UPI002E7A1044|nr:TspO/MBR family protein [Gemmiger sp.]MEE0707807.1 TspO/MBR family protein [Gemmiger sp.]
MKKFGFILFPAISLGVGALAGFLTKDSLANVYPLLEKSSLTPPGWVFPIAWTVLYLLMGIGMALVEARGGPERSRALTLFGIQLALNFGWSLLFFNSGAYLSALLCLIVLWVMILAMAGSFASVSRPAAWLQIPYLLWVAFAGCLNAAVWVLNW